MFSLFALLSLFTLANAAPQAASTSSNCVGTIRSLNDVANAVKCTTVNIESFIVPAGKTFELDLLPGTTVNVHGNIRFRAAYWSGPLFQIIGTDITFNGNGHLWDGNGPKYWDGLGGTSPQHKPNPMMSVWATGTISGVYVVNSPAGAFSLGGSGPLLVKDVTVNDKQGDHPNSKSNGQPAGRNTDGFDIGGNNITLQGCTVYNQDDCVAIKFGSGIVIRDNHCYNGHGISIGSVESNTVIQDIQILDNKVFNSVQAYRIKTKKDATNSTVKGIHFSGNSATGCSQYGFVLTQSYPDWPGHPGGRVMISDINFVGDTTRLEVNSGANAVVVDCAHGTCSGEWNWQSLQTSGGKAMMTNSPSITGYKY